MNVLRSAALHPFSQTAQFLRPWPGVNTLLFFSHRR